MFKNHLLYRIVIFNGFIGAFLLWAWMHGYVQRILAGETTGIGYVMITVFVLAFCGLMVRVQKASNAFNEVKAGTYVDVRKLAIKSSFVAAVGVWLGMLGLIGNILGFSQAVESLNVAGGPDAALQSIAGMTAGMKVAFYTTLVGISLGLWLGVNSHILNTTIALLKIDAEALKVPFQQKVTLNNILDGKSVNKAFEAARASVAAELAVKG
ncbi:MotA/TolQ/ExbB proton channel family protein [Mesorhizobium sp. B2-8-9]|uniref:MotA/TolQ/ExbB proton channel family protein n=1 Tax=Mesorhizobium sp. B2-8-9 TaxID=2589899 RepID=UPI00112ACD3C|nr:MotA/TolQ/ExbB proton channel family protein [Mesorhizobium sp. B2-8-9]TPI86428.1 MotA/TolQ/ExbB proton channel family protein [Mesorhizobium sp. B2-8-9]